MTVADGGPAVEAAAGPEAGREAAVVALATSLLGLAALVVMYWLVLPAVVLGLIGMALGVRAYRRASTTGIWRDVATVAVCCAVFAIVFTPVTLMQVKSGEDWGRDCALHPEQDPNC
jgi:hypothetical protein